MKYTNFQKTGIKRNLVAIGTLTLILFAGCKTALFKFSGVNNNQLPNVVLWAWERPEDLSFLDGNKVGVAYLASQIRVQGDNVIARPRLQPLRFPKDARLIAVVRIESDRSSPPSLSDGQRTKVASEIAAVAKETNISAVQIDFDAKQSERDFYRRLITDLRKQWPSEIGLNITALASWCISDTWIRDLEIDDAVPMLFRMGVDDSQVRMYLRSGQDFSLDICRNSVGISTDEPVEGLPSGRRVYLFNPHLWSQEFAERAIASVTVVTH